MKQYILMADIIESGEKAQTKLMQDFKNLVSSANQVFKTALLSPLTITLGDEFQGVMKNLSSSLEMIIHLEEQIIHQNLKFQLRYVLQYGLIETPINPDIAYQMLGKGLTEARNRLNNSKKNKNRFSISIEDATKNRILENAFHIYENIISHWNAEKDYELISNFIKFEDYKTVSKQVGKTRSQIWKREKTLNITSYQAIKNIIHLTSHKD
jgi:hypothetical protein